MVVDKSKALEKSKGFANEFREFIMRGNVMDLAVGVIIGGAFQSIINSLVNDIIMPVISVLTGGIDFSNWFVSLDGSKYSNLAAAQEAGAATLNYGVFITAVINFLLMALVIFCIVKSLNKVSEKVKKEQEEEAPTTKICPHCKSEINIEATKCPCCTSDL
ncbi:large conductance mechanosensitive channel [Butyrivibrio sp. ob235]|uniref:large conductance mechanosensitive channel protein MscL n=1 Tax=unclassified Butyrivibrio TaxID=2639466 RepID=UPI0003B49E31|nr:MULTISPECIES: large conductance mechanosensitive channel protein MscL [unclassified Butyrivibrio]SEL49471.1 large conductance mechanosensitive channel [Butyrivibrio sp. ob235]